MVGVIYAVMFLKYTYFIELAPSKYKREKRVHPWTDGQLSIVCWNFLVTFQKLRLTLVGPKKSGAKGDISCKEKQKKKNNKTNVGN